MKTAIEVDSREVVQRLDGAGGFMRTEITTRFRQFGRQLRTELRAEIPRVTGRARRAIRSRLLRRRQAADVTLIVDGNLRIAPHLRTLEHGASIVPKRAQRLTVPIGAATTRRGVARFSAREVRDNPQAYGFAKTWISGEAILGERLSGRVDPLFALEKQVIVPRRRYFANKVRQRRTQAVHLIRQAIRAALRRRVVTSAR